MELRYRRMVETRRLYAFEDIFTRLLPKEARRTRTIEELRLLAERVWAKHGRAGSYTPRVRAGQGLTHNDKWYSYADGFSLIVLSRAQRTVAVLLHELTHTMGHGTHGRNFVRKYSALLVEYAGVDPGELRTALELFHIRH